MFKHIQIPKITDKNSKRGTKTIAKTALLSTSKLNTLIQIHWYSLTATKTRARISLC